MEDTTMEDTTMEIKTEELRVVADDRSSIVQSKGEIHGRAIQQQEHNRGYLESFGKDPKLLFWVALLLWAQVVQGFESQASGTVIGIGVFKRRFGVYLDGEYDVATKWQSAMSGGGTAAIMVGAWLGSYIADMVGNKPVIMAAAALGMASIGIEFAATSIGMYFGGKFLNFVAVRAFMNNCTTYIADISPLTIRASLVGLNNVAQCVGPLICAVMAYYTTNWTDDWSWKSLICTQWGFAGITLIGSIFMPESPVYLLEKGKETAARKVLSSLYSKPSDAEGHFESIKLTLQEAETQSSNLMDCFRGTNLRRTLIAILVFQAQPMSGLGFVYNYGALMYQYLGISDRQSFLLSIGGQILSISGAFIAVLVSDLYGR
ncbi:hypothetical protein A1O1_04306 [Capronia coronata CBS 617.96]|uniref:Major facilitator superfamily (MFS) profile domain-containing protein n=1 Tax=Capronia coronata CBS 617.96 TaxID=1182541 RepID=W9YE89_9EURO|nr:uncharacterized protein A1O1_04306 [Capronia coronata CBS 617.96]EXJ91197.1 hypothetical protein A1O1_04306 [Capronia coronata CBS 617.96]